MLSEEKKISELSLRELSIQAVQLWQDIEEAQLIASAPETQNNTSEETNTIGLVVQKLLQNQDAMAEKVDAIVWVIGKLKAELKGWEARREHALQLYQSAIEVRESAINKMVSTLLHLYNIGLISEKNMGKECEIEIRNNPPKVASILMDIESDNFPSQFKRVIATADNKAIINAYKLGIDVSNYVEITTGKHVRFKSKKTKKK
ncbi:hypothetical protein NIES4071_102570 (plasmid) [Calothrix sp. NIES-4071]|nr:hypothetical protein NIES4071_102570 [Calothrix sp. NIES-4071]BAZ64638.1 hypothetical protein NIES4105_103710 [Calothrix sp. NIES-4105]